MNFFRKNLPTNRRSQIAVIITFVIAVIFLFIAVFINLAKVSQVKTTTSTSADKAALSLASQLGSISHYYKDKVLKIAGSCATPPCQACDDDSISLAVLIGVIIVFGLTIIPTMGASLIALPLALVMTASILSGINAKFTEMTGYNAFRESTLFQALASIQSDDVELKSAGPGIFRDAETGKNYDLSAIPEMRNQKKVSRFAAWYYALRLPLVGEEAIKSAIEKFLSDPVGGLRSFVDVDVDGWDPGKWKINKMSYVISPGSGSLDYEVTCTSTAPCSSGDTACTQCPDWVKDPAQGILRMVEIDSSDNVYGGFLKDKLMNLLSRLEASYNLSFCDFFGCSDVNILINGDLREFLIRSKEVLNMPVSERLNYLTQWFPLWYDFKRHNETREPIDSADPNKYTYDIYLRLMRDQNNINSWIAELEKINGTASAGNISNNIVDTIRSKHGECTWGWGASVSSTCYMQYGCSKPECGTHCCGSDCSDECCNTCCYPSSRKSPCAWEGTYYTCCQNPPVCSNGDLYGAKPSWCTIHADHANCHSNCGCSVQSFNCDDDAKNFQGQLSWKPRCSDPTSCIYFDSTSGPTEAEQAIRILRALDDNIAKIKMSIAALADKVSVFLSEKDTKRNEIVYAWKDKPKSDGSQQFSHFVKVKIDGYPESLPNITESLEWKWPAPQKCRTLNNYQDNFTIITWRYDQDQPTDIGKTDNEGWKLKRRKIPGAEEFSPKQLEDIVADIQANGKIDSTQNSVDSILDYAITSCSKAHYGPEKKDIYISGIRCD